MASRSTIEISPEAWKEASIHSIKLAQTIIGRSGRGVSFSRRTDPLPLLRDACVKESNEQIRSYVRATRTVVMSLRNSLVATNEEIKALTRGKEALERALEHKRKDLALNQHSSETRSCRPPREKDMDYADRLLMTERTHLLSLKRALEAQLRKVQQQLQVLNVARSRLAAVIQERSRVTDLLCHSMSSTVHITGGVQGKGRPASMRHSKSFSAPAPLMVSDLPAMAGNGVMPPGAAGPYKSLSPEAVEAMSLSSDAISKSRTIRQELHVAIDHTHRLQQAAHDSVNEGLTRKLAQTVTLTQHLQVNTGETNLAVHRTQRYYDAQQKAQGYLMESHCDSEECLPIMDREFHFWDQFILQQILVLHGPVSSADLTTREKLDRPLVRVYQRHPGTDLPEAGHLVQASDLYAESMEATRRNISLLKLAEKRLQEDVMDKKMATNIDSSIVRLRRRRANHKWVLGGTMNSATVRLTN